MPDSIKLSIVIPVYNEERYIDAILERVCAVRFQDGVELEYIAVDDHSTDRTWERLQGWAGRGIRISRHEENGGKGADLPTPPLPLATPITVLIHEPDASGSFTIPLAEGQESCDVQPFFEGHESHADDI